MYIRRSKKRILVSLVFLAGIAVILADIINMPSMSGSFEPSFEVGVVSTSDVTTWYQDKARTKEVGKKAVYYDANM